MKKFTTYNVTSKDIAKKWYIIDADGIPLGRVAVKAAYVLRGKHKPTYTPHLDTGDNIIIINASKAIMTGNKTSDKIYYHHTGYMGGLKETTYEKMMEKKPVFPMEAAVKGMLPKGPLGREMFRNLRVYEGAEYNEASQKPEKLEIK
ncbi:MAG: 50S ribosomal protein L13 [Spirochaetes bacterium GWF1_31_7]|nr:MAG: 50S ribosomal protein L13 [Spirochaetes bacterium GWE1_32_154]OHD52593.1 MAG: 50S ribosomal protein L13 [Spirochaetes bacterium GWE2_31_10]OHD52961.1 MAG: 50S ribosomal protein L13 [Spirochaetes bacterium GWF1_31_7]OHD80235.1 MAG: 50S ribosomal protein L13 [Spirochaetes bacterium RIFOXYB1_FULL_32_8]HBD93705.1 50S ribosomal protein L13 [Spirochaetia bacterium]